MDKRNGTDRIEGKEMERNGKDRIKEKHMKRNGTDQIEGKHMKRNEAERMGLSPSTERNGTEGMKRTRRLGGVGG